MAASYTAARPSTNAAGAASPTASTASAAVHRGTSGKCRRRMRTSSSDVMTSATMENANVST